MALRWRPDGDYVGNLDATRRIIPFLMQRRNESAVYFEQKIDVSRTEVYLADFRQRTGLRATMLHLLIWGIVRTVADRPRLNRFTAGTRIYQRRGIWLSFSAKKGKSDDHPIVTVKRQFDPAWTLEQVVRHVEGDVAEGRSDRPSTTDKELGVLLRLPALLLDMLVRLQFLLDRFGLLPDVFIRNDPMYASAFIAPLGSIGLDAGYHHLYEYGNIPIFVVSGRIRPEPTATSAGAVEVRPTMTIRYTYDERIEDGLYCAQALELLRRRLEDPASEVSAPYRALQKDARVASA